MQAKHKLLIIGAAIICPPSFATTILGACQYTMYVGSTAHGQYVLGTLPSTHTASVFYFGGLSPNANPSTTICYQQEAVQTFSVYIEPGNVFVGNVTAVIDQVNQTTQKWSMKGSTTFAMPQLPVGSYRYTVTNSVDQSPVGDTLQVVTPTPPAPPAAPMVAFRRFLPAINQIINN